MPKQLIEIDVPDGFEVDGDLYCKVRPCFSVNSFSVMVPFRRKLSYGGSVFASALHIMSRDMQADKELAWTWHCNLAVLAADQGLSHEASNRFAANFMKLAFGCDTRAGSPYADQGNSDEAEPAPPRTSVCSNYAFGVDMAAEGTNSFTACHYIPRDENPRYNSAAVGMCVPREVYLPHPDLPFFRGRCHGEVLVEIRFGLLDTLAFLSVVDVLTASAQPSPPELEPVPIESDLSEQVTRLLRHLGIDVPPTAAEVDDLVRCTLNSLRAENWVDLGERLLPQIKEIHLGDGKSVRVSGEIHRDDWQWPEWLNKEWLFLTQRGVWMAGNDEPELRYGDWWIKAFSGTWEAMSPDFVPPPCTDWRQSKRRNPQWKD